MAFSTNFPDIHTWLQTLPSITQWKPDSISVCICSSGVSKPPLYLSVSKDLHSPTVYFSICTDFNFSISFWTSKSIQISSKSVKLMDDESISSLLTNIIEDVISYGPNKCRASVKVPELNCLSNFKDMFNLSFLKLSFLVCIYEVPTDLRLEFLLTLENELVECESRDASKSLMRVIGSNLEEQWMRSRNLAITNRIVEYQGAYRTIKAPSPLFSYSFTTPSLWKIQLYCPIIAMDIESSSNSTANKRLLFSLRHHQLEGVIQFNYKVVVQEECLDLILKIDNIRFADLVPMKVYSTNNLFRHSESASYRCDVIQLITDRLMNERGVGTKEKHFPSRISLHFTPIAQTNIISVSVSKSSENMEREFQVGKSIETSFEPPNPFVGIKLAAGLMETLSLKPWKFEESVYGASAILNWFLHNTADGQEVFSSKPSKLALFSPKSWFRNRYSRAYRPFTRQGGVIFAGDEYGESICWKIDKSALGKTMEWEIKGWIWLTYLPNKYRSFYTETRRLEFKDIVHLTIA